MSKMRIIIILLAGFLIPTNAPAQSPYHLNSQNDAIVSAISLALAGAGSYLNQYRHVPFTEAELSLLSRNQVNRFDRTATYEWSEN